MPQAGNDERNAGRDIIDSSVHRLYLDPSPGRHAGGLQRGLLGLERRRCGEVPETPRHLASRMHVSISHTLSTHLICLHFSRLSLHHGFSFISCNSFHLISLRLSTTNQTLWFWRRKPGSLVASLPERFDFHGARSLSHNRIALRADLRQHHKISGS